MQKIIIITGALATGKSTFSALLSDKLLVPSINKDNIKEILSDNFGFSSREENLKLSHATYEIMKYFMQRLMMESKDFILEANFHDKEIKELEQIIEKNNYKSLFLVLSGDIDILYSRFNKRSLNRHSCHLSGPTTYDSFKEYIQKNNKINYSLSNIIYINADTFKYQEDENLLRKIEDFIYNN